MGKVFAALGAFWVFPLKNLGSAPEVLDERRLAAGTAEANVRFAQTISAERTQGPARLRRASAATTKWAQEKAVSFGFLATLFVTVCGSSAGLLITEHDPPLVKVGIGVLGALVGYLALLLTLTVIFWVKVGPKPATA